jgi:hypothetical protein
MCAKQQKCLETNELNNKGGSREGTLDSKGINSKVKAAVVVRELLKQYY